MRGQGRSLRGNVDRNDMYYEYDRPRLRVVPYVGTWIEMYMRIRYLHVRRVVPYVGTWIEIS